MTVRELIEKLKDLPPESVVVAREMDGGFMTVGPDDVEVERRHFNAIGNGKYGYWDRVWNTTEGQMVVVIRP